VQAQRARCRLAVNSYEGESTSVRLAICRDELSSHKANVGVESVWGAITCIQIRTSSGKRQIDLADQAFEVRDERRIVTRDP